MGRTWPDRQAANVVQGATGLERSRETLNAGDPIEYELFGLQWASSATSSYDRDVICLGGMLKSCANAPKHAPLSGSRNITVLACPSTQKTPPVPANRALSSQHMAHSDIDAYSLLSGQSSTASCETSDAFVCTCLDLVSGLCLSAASSIRPTNQTEPSATHGRRGDQGGTPS